MRPGVVGKEDEIVRGTVLNIGDHSVVPGIGACNHQGRCSTTASTKVERSLRWILQSQHRTILRIARVGTRLAGTGRSQQVAVGRGAGARTCPVPRDVDDRIERITVRRMRGLVRNVVDLELPSVRKLMLN